jgi:hypothetical protein
MQNLENKKCIFMLPDGKYSRSDKNAGERERKWNQSEFLNILAHLIVIDFILFYSF